MTASLDLHTKEESPENLEAARGYAGLLYMTPETCRALFDILDASGIGEVADAIAKARPVMTKIMDLTTSQTI